MILIDTSIWIEFFKRKNPYFQQLTILIENSQVLAVEVVFAELIQGARDKRERDIILGYWHNLPKYEEPNLVVSAAVESNKNNWIASGVGLIDSIIIFASRKTSSKVWSIDKKLNSLLSENEIYHK